MTNIKMATFTSNVDRKKVTKMSYFPGTTNKRYKVNKICGVQHCLFFKFVERMETTLL